MKAAAKKLGIAIFSFCLAFIFTGCQTSPAQKSAGTDLFNGKDFSGWTFFMRSNSAPEKTWGITNGVIHCTGRPNGFMRTEKSYSNYVCTVEWRFLKAGNTGVLVDMQLPDNVWSPCVECQGMHDHQGDFWLWGGAHCNEPKNMKKNGIKMLQPSAENPVGEWNTFQTVCAGDSVEIIVNGKSMNKLTGCNFSSGFIGIQSEGADMEVRKIFLAPLN
jgi:3-keto-disaccharide hydrolase